MVCFQQSAVKKRSVQRSCRVPEDVLDVLQFRSHPRRFRMRKSINRHSPPHIQQGLTVVGQSQLSTVFVCSNEVRVSHARVVGRHVILWIPPSEMAQFSDPLQQTHQRFNQWSPHDRGDDWCCCKNQFWLKVGFLARNPCCCLTQGEFCVTFPFVPHQDVASCHAKDGGLWRRLRGGTR